jgi:hypothetical protein
LGCLLRIIFYLVDCLGLGGGVAGVFNAVGAVGEGVSADSAVQRPASSFPVFQLPVFQ